MLPNRQSDTHSLHVSIVGLLFKRPLHVDARRYNSVLFQLDHGIMDRRCYFKNRSRLDRHRLNQMPLGRACQLSFWLIPRFKKAVSQAVSLGRVPPLIFLGVKCLPIESKHRVIFNWYSGHRWQHRSFFDALSFHPDLCLCGARVSIPRLVMFGLVRMVTYSAWGVNRFTYDFSLLFTWLHEEIRREQQLLVVVDALSIEASNPVADFLALFQNEGALGRLFGNALRLVIH